MDGSRPANRPCPPKTHLGMPACSASSASIMAAPGSLSLGFSTIVLPAVVAMGIIQSGTIAGKLKGQIPATTCSGQERAWVSLPGAQCSVGPLGHYRRYFGPSHPILVEFRSTSSHPSTCPQAGSLTLTPRGWRIV